MIEKPKNSVASCAVWETRSAWSATVITGLDSGHMGANLGHEHLRLGDSFLPHMLNENSQDVVF